MEPKTKEEMEAFAKEHFGEEATVYYSNYQWTISTGVEERFEEEKYKDREAYALYKNNSYGENELERWGYKNGYSGESLAELFDSYDEEAEISFRHSLSKVRQKIAEGFDFEGTGLEDYRDRMLKYAEEKGW